MNSQSCLPENRERRRGTRGAISGQVMFAVKEQGLENYLALWLWGGVCWQYSTLGACSENPSQSFMLDSREREQVAIKKEIRT